MTTLFSYQAVNPFPALRESAGVRVLSLCLWSMVYGLWSSAGDISSIQHRDVDPAGYLSQDLIVRRGESSLFQFHYTNMGFSVSNSVKFNYAFGDLSTNPSHYVITGYVSAATSGMAIVRWTSATAPAAGLYSYETLVEDTVSTSINARAFGMLDVRYGVASGSTNTLPQTPLDMLLYSVLNAGAAPWIVEPSSASSNQVLVWNGSAWTAGDAGSGDMTKTIYDPLNVGTVVVFTTDARLAKPAAATNSDVATYAVTAGTASNLVAGYKPAAATNSDVATYAVTAGIASNMAPGLSNLVFNAQNQTNITRSWGGMLDRFPTGAADNVYLSSAFLRAGTVTGISLYCSGTLTGDVLIQHWTNQTYVPVVTGVTWGATVTNWITNLAVAVDSVIGFRITNGSATNAFGELRYTVP